MHGTLIVLEGPDGAGTTTHAMLLAESLKNEGHDVVSTAEPTPGPIGSWIRELLKSGTASPDGLQLLFSADRAWHVETVIAPALAAGKVVICDRYFHSTIVYAEAQNLETDFLKRINADFPQPDCCIFTLPPLKTSLERLERRPDREMFEQENLQRRIHAGYTGMANADPTIHAIDTSGPKDAAATQILLIAQRLLSSRNV